LEAALYIVATPIGNLGDMTRRAIEVLEQADIVAAEDTRRTGQLLASLGLRRRLLAYHEHSTGAAGARILDAVREGHSVALVSDAGTPTISDPGYRLVRSLQDAGQTVVPIPGACALIAALSASGLPSDRFSFGGFLPAKREARRRRLHELATGEGTHIFYEAPHRLRDCLDDMLACLGAEREAALARELTKRFETLRRAPLGELAAWVREDADQVRGEVVLLLGPAPGPPAVLADEALLALLSDLAGVLPARQAARLLARHCGHSARELYSALIAQRDGVP